MNSLKPFTGKLKRSTGKKHLLAVFGPCLKCMLYAYFTTAFATHLYFLSYESKGINEGKSI